MANTRKEYFLNVVYKVRQVNRELFMTDFVIFEKVKLKGNKIIAYWLNNKPAVEIEFLSKEVARKIYNEYMLDDCRHKVLWQMILEEFKYFCKQIYKKLKRLKRVES